MISVSCSCGRRFKAEDHHAGKRTRCPVCGNMLVIGQSAIPGPSGISDNSEVPSWWFPSNPGPRTTTATPPTTRSGSGSGSGAGAGATPTISPRWSSPPSPPWLTIRPGVGATTRGRIEASNADHGADRWGRGGRHPRPGGPRLVPAARRRQWRAPLPHSPSSPGGRGNWRDAGGGRGHRRTIDARREFGREAGTTAGVRDATKPTGTGCPRPPRFGPAPAPDTRLFLPFRHGHESLAASPGGLHEGPDRRDRQSQKRPRPSGGCRVSPGHRQGGRREGHEGDRLRQHGVRRGRSQDEVKDDIDRCIVLYPTIQGFFFDQQSPLRQHAAYYIQLREYVRHKLDGKPSLVVGNPGTTLTCDTTQDEKSRTSRASSPAPKPSINSIRPYLPRTQNPLASPPCFTRSPTPRPCDRSSRKPSSKASAISTSPTRRRGATPGGSSPATGRRDRGIVAVSLIDRP